MIFQVRRYKEPDNPQDGYEDVEAESAKKAAEKVCGEPLTVRGPRWNFGPWCSPILKGVFP